MRTIAERLAYNRRNAKNLNPAIFNSEDELKSDVRSMILEIVNEFLEYTQVDVRIIDIRLVGSNASYNYNNQSDLDIHIITDLSEISEPESIARLYFDSVKKNFKDSYDITIKGIDVELYVEDINTSSVSNGIYSVSEDKWIKFPEPVEGPTSEQFNRAEEIEEDIIAELKSANTNEELQKIIDNIYLLRKDSLAKDGENAPGNLAFKSLRNKGILDKVKDVMRSSTSRKLSLESLETSYF